MAQYAFLVLCLFLMETCQSMNSNVKKDDEELAEKVTMVSSVNKRAKLRANDFLERLRINLNLSESASQSNPGTEKPSKFETKSDAIQSKEVEISPNTNNTGFKYGTQAPMTSSFKDTALDIESPSLKPVLEVGSSSITSAIMETKNKIITANDGKKLDTADRVRNISPTPSLQKGKTAEKKESEAMDKVEPTPAVVVIDPDDNMAEEDLFLEENSRSSTKDGVSQHHEEYEQEEDNWYQDANILDSKETSPEDEDEWDFWNDHQEVVTDKKSNVADKFGDFWDEQSYARGPYLKEAIMTSSSVEDSKHQVLREMNLMTFYSWVLFISLSLLVLYVFYRQKNVFKPYWSYLYQSSKTKRRMSSEDTTEERKGLVHHAYA